MTEQEKKERESKFQRKMLTFTDEQMASIEAFRLRFNEQNPGAELDPTKAIRLLVNRGLAASGTVKR